MRRSGAARVALVSVAAAGVALVVSLNPWEAGASDWRGADATAASPQPGRAEQGGSQVITPPALSPLQPVQLDVTFHAQQDPDWCDPADIEMWLQADGIALPASDDYSVQQELWEYETANNDGYTIDEWNASPYAVAVTLDQYGGWTDVGDAPQPSVEAAGVVIAESVAELHQPAIVMVAGGTHYVLVTGVVLSPAGAGAPPVQVVVANPLAYGVGGSPPAGSDGETTMSWQDFTAWYTPNTAHGGVWAGEWVLIAPGIPLVG